MAESLVGGALLSAAFNVLLEKLTPEQVDLINSVLGKELNNKLLNHLKPNLIAARAVLNDAELKQFKDPVVKDWLDELRDAAYDLKDLMDDISTRASTQKKVCYFSFASLNLGDTSMANKLESITDRIEHIVGLKDALNLEKSGGTETLTWRAPVTSNVQVSEVQGRMKEREDIIKLMFNGEGDQLLSVIPIVGMGGVGKTTLVKLIYNDKDVKRKFDLAIWVCVSEAFDFVRIAQSMIKSISPDFVCNDMDLNLLQLRLAEMLKGKTFLVVFDDVWNDKYTDWDTLKNLLHNGVEGCKILVTTRLESVALMVTTISSFYRLNVLSDEECLSIFTVHAFPFRDSSTVNSCLERIGRDVATKCKGLPLAAKVLGGLFRSKPDSKNWNDILKDSMWDSFDKEVIPVLKVSYYYLPPHLKQCFAYCSLFPEDHQFDKEELILMWMAEGFLQPSKGNMTLEEVGYRCFDDLTLRSFFQPLPENDEPLDLLHKGKDNYFVMHDLIHELATRVAGDFYFRKGENGNKFGNKIRHLSCHFQSNSCLDHNVFQKIKGLRTFVVLTCFPFTSSFGKSSHMLLSNMKYLRTLSLRNLRDLSEVPKSIGEFIHLCYLDLSRTSIVCLPDSICKLYNLQMLKLVFCVYLKILPSNMQDLVNLRHLDVRSTPLNEMTTGFGNLKRLQFLSDFIVGKEVGIEELGGISNLKSCIAIRNLENVNNENEAYKARMMEKKQVKELTLSWFSNAHGMEDTRIDRDILGNLRPHWHLEELVIDGYRGTTFPDWLGSPSYHNMTRLELNNCSTCCMLPPLGQLPALKELGITGLLNVVIIGDELLKGNDCASMVPFPSLEHIRFMYMTSLEIWHSINKEAFPKLQSLYISHCPKFVGNLPYQLLSLTTLHISECPLLSSSIPRCPKLQDLGIHSGNIVWQEQEFLPPSLLELHLTGFLMLESLLDALSKNSYLQKLSIHDCPNILPLIIHLPQSLQHLKVGWCKMVHLILSSTPPLQNLHSITITACDFVKFTVDDMEGFLPNLRNLSINDCHEMETFPKGMLVPSLRELHIASCDKLLSPQAEWPHLSNITYLHVSNQFDGVRCFPEGCFLPITITILEICCIPSLDTLNCIGLQHLTSLQELKIMLCDKLEKMSGEKLPTSLRELRIWECPLLERKYHNKDAQLLRKISHIPLIKTGHKW